ncbi:MAG: ribonuclease Z [Solirubrobacterales bacterium]|nr:ribonuclease Z [Solirubrobacterales bacterium]
MDFSVVFIGTAGSVPTARRGLPANLIRHEGIRLLVDCGEGTQRQLVKSTGLADLDAVFITHFHADHWLGLPGLLKTFDLRDRERPLTVHGPEGIQRILDFCVDSAGATRYEVVANVITPGNVVKTGNLNVAAFEASHRGRAVGYAMFEDDRPGRIDLEKVAAHGIQPGPDLGLIQSGETVNGVSPADVMGPARQGRKIVLTGDTTPCDSLLVASHDADLLVHEATFLHEDAERASERGHSTALEAAECARDAEVKLLAMTHLSGRYFGPEHEEEARSVFPNSHVPRDFDFVEIPFRESGEPTLSRPERRGQKATQTPSQQDAEQGATL